MLASNGMTRSFREPGTSYWWRLVPLALALGWLVQHPKPAVAQALTVQRIGPTVVTAVTMPLAELTAACWPVRGAEVACVSGGRVGFLAALEGAAAELESAPPVVMVVGASSSGDAVGPLRARLQGLPAEGIEATAAAGVRDGWLNRRLGRPGQPAQLRLEVALPPAEHRLRSAAEVLWTLIPDGLDESFEGLDWSLDREVAALQLRLDPDLADVELRRLRLALARMGSDPDLTADAVAGAAQRLRIRRVVFLENSREAAAFLVGRWLAAGEEGVREYLFGAEGVSLNDVRVAAREWLATHPGEAELTLPPRVFNPRFAPGPQVTILDNNLSMAVLERPGAVLSALVLRPVLLSDLTGEAASQVLSRLAVVIRSQTNPPGGVRVALHPPRLELVGPADGFAGLVESLQRALDDLEGDQIAVAPVATARSRALALMAARLGVSGPAEVTADVVLRADNLAVGGLADDAESATEAARKFGLGGRPRDGAPSSSRIRPEGQRSRQAAAGEIAAVALAIPMPAHDLQAAALVALTGTRLEREIPDAEVEVLSPLVPGRRVAVVVVQSEGDLEALERLVQQAWPSVRRQASEEEVTALRRQLSSAMAAERGGVLGRARTCAAIAAGEVQWRAPADSEMATLMLSASELGPALEAIPEWEAVSMTGAGRLPIVNPEEATTTE